jgi:hypothetical protein
MSDLYAQTGFHFNAGFLATSQLAKKLSQSISARILFDTGGRNITGYYINNLS